MSEKKVFESDKIWSEIENVNVSMFALPSRKINEVAKKIELGAEYLYLKLESQAVLPAMETALQGKFNFEVTEGGFTIVKRAQNEDYKLKQLLSEMKKNQ